MDSLTYQTGFSPVNWGPTPLRGRYLRRSLNSKAEAAFVGADLYRGVKHLVEPSLMQVAAITGSDVNAVWWALRREEHRSDICGNCMPLVPARPKKPQLPVTTVPIVDDAEILSIVRKYGIAATLDACCAIEAVAAE